jgi:hypothetical protein
LREQGGGVCCGENGVLDVGVRKRCHMDIILTYDSLLSEAIVSMNVGVGFAIFNTATYTCTQFSEEDLLSSHHNTAELALHHG